MATGPEHYREAEDLLATVRAIGMGDGTARDRLAAAQTHALLAHAAASGLGLPAADGAGMAVHEAAAWQDAAGTPPPAERRRDLHEVLLSRITEFAAEHTRDLDSWATRDLLAELLVDALTDAGYASKGTTR